MRVEILKPVAFRGEVKRSGALEAPDAIAKHWIDTGVAKAVEVPNPPAAAERGQKRF